MPLARAPAAAAAFGRRDWRGPAIVAAAFVLTGGLALAGGATPLTSLCAGVIAGAAALLARTSLPREADETISDVPDGPSLAPLLLPTLEALPDPLLLISDEADKSARRIVFANLPARRLLRLPHEGAPLLGVVRRPELLEVVEHALAGEPAEATFETGGALERFWRAHGRTLVSPEGARLALVMVRDETDARRHERMRADFLANASHELRTPLASLMGFVDTLRGHAKDDPAAQERFLGIMAEQAGRMRRLLDDLLALSRIELNEHIPPASICDLAGAAADVADALAPLAAEKGVALDLDLAPAGAAEIVGDYDQIVQVVQNLLANAVKYAPAGSRVRLEVTPALALDAAQAGEPDSARGREGKRLRLLAPDRVEGERYARVRVIDEGPGMKREHLPRLSERFYRVEGQKSGDRQGTGLGLAIVKHIVNRHRGGLTVESAPGLGAAFDAYFPMAEGVR